jgi:hypothetical protein
MQNVSQKIVKKRPKSKSQSTAKTKADLMNNADPVETLAKIGKVKNLKDGGSCWVLTITATLNKELKVDIRRIMRSTKLSPTGHVLESQVFHRISITRDYLNIY